MPNSLSESLVQRCTDLDRQPRLLSNEDAGDFFQEFSLENLFSILSNSALTDQDIQLIASVLSKLFTHPSGLSLIPQALQYLDAALGSPLGPLRRLAVQQYCSLAVQHDSEENQKGCMASNQEHASMQLIKAMRDPSTGIVQDAQAALTTWALAEPDRLQLLLNPDTSLGSQISQLSSCSDATIRLRALSLFIMIGSKGGQAASEIVKSTGDAGGSTSPGIPLGIFWGTPIRGNAISSGSCPLFTRPSPSSTEATPSGSVPPTFLSSVTLLISGAVQRLLLQELSSSQRDPLSALSALSTVSELVQDQSEYQSERGSASFERPGLALAGPLCEAVIGALPQLIAEPLLLPGALRVAGVLVRATLSQEGETGTAADNLALLLRGIHGILDDTGSHSAEDEAAALDCVGQLTHLRVGAERFTSDRSLLTALLERALGRAVTQDVRIAALHTLATLSGAQRIHEWEQRSAALLSTGSEEALRVAAYMASSSQSKQRSPLEVLTSLMDQPFHELKFAAYHAAAGLALRPWFAADMCHNNELLRKLLDPCSESGQVACSWRYAVVTSLWSTIQASSKLHLGHPDKVHSSTLASAAAPVEASLKVGPYGSGQTATFHHTHMVATLP